MEKPWYILEYEEKDYLHGKKLELKGFTPDHSGDHRHCELCWARISYLKEDSNSGYYEIFSKSWICEDCYNNFKDLFGWTVK